MTPFELVDIDPAGRVRVRFATRRWYPTIELETSFLAPAPIGELVGEGIVVRAGSSVVFAEARMWTRGDMLVAHATASSLAAERGAAKASFRPGARALLVVDEQHLASVVAILDSAVLRTQVAQLLGVDAEGATDLDRVAR